MGNTGLLRSEAKMTLLQPHLGEMRCQELRNSPFWPSSLFKSQSRREKTSSSKKAPLKMLRVSDPIKISPFVVPTIRKEAPTGNAPMGPTLLKAVTNRFPQVGGNQILDAPMVVFNPPLGGKGVETLPPQRLLKSLPQSTSRMLPPFFQKRLANKQMFKQRVKHYHQWLCSSIHFKTKSC